MAFSTKRMRQLDVPVGAHKSLILFLPYIAEIASQMKNFFFLLFFFAFVSVQGQAGYQPGNVVTNLAFAKVLNAPDASSSFDKLKGTITILDFFGTWCVPCIKALPVLTKLQQSNSDVKVILISIEEETKLKSFLAKRTNFPFPVVMDEREVITGFFQPPSLPYTVVLDKNGKVLSITEATDINEAKLTAWRAGKGDEIKTPELPVNKQVTQTNSFMKSSNSSVALSQEFIYAAKTGDKAEEFVKKLGAMDYLRLRSSLQTDAEKKAFWINLYNGYTQHFLRNSPEKYQNRGKFFGAKQINVAGKNLSLDDIEHGLLRRSKIKWGLGYLNKLFTGETEKELRVEEVDYRIHFALNCGAKSCPPIAFYAPEKLDQQLEVATKSYLSSEAEIDEGENTAHLPAIMGWFRGDFSGKKGMRELLQKHGFAKVHASTKIKFRDYDWMLYLDNFKNL